MLGACSLEDVNSALEEAVILVALAIHCGGDGVDH
jgi:hypothetical protein